MNKSVKKYDIIVVGSGAGGATVAKELALRGKDVMVVEKGEQYSSFGTMKDIISFHDASTSNTGLRYSEEGVMLLRTFMAGGSTIVSCGNGIRCLEKELTDLDISLVEEFSEAELELEIAPISEDFLSEGSRAIMSASKELGYTMELMPKFINQTLCSNCGGCFAGCQNGAKWTAFNYLEQAINAGADIIYGTSVHEIMAKNGKVRGIISENKQGVIKILADTVILSAGALSTPLILNNSGIQAAGKGLFVDIFVNVYGVTTGLNLKNELPMALVDIEFYDDDGFILSTFINSIKISRFAELGSQALATHPDKLIGLMVKIQDERSGCVHPDGTISKQATQKDQAKLRRGVKVAKEILAKAGADDKSFMISIPQGAHPGGTAAIGEIVNNNLETEIENLFVCDASIFPVSPGLPPILTIVALGKRLAKTLV